MVSFQWENKQKNKLRAPGTPTHFTVLHLSNIRRKCSVSALREKQQKARSKTATFLNDDTSYKFTFQRLPFTVIVFNNIILFEPEC